MARALAYAAAFPRHEWDEFARAGIVGFCAMALIFAGNAHPFF